MTGKREGKIQIFKHAPTFGTEALEQEVSRIQTKELRDLYHRFCENMNTVSMMANLPILICADEFLGFNRLLLTIEARLASKVGEWEQASEDDKKRYLAEEKRIWESKYKPKGKELAYDAADKGIDKFNLMLQRPEIQKAYRSLLYSAIVFIWCSFEMVMKDTWETSLNLAGKHVKSLALENIGKVENNDNYGGIRGKYVNLNYLAQYNFNVSNKLGSITVNKFDFTSPYGIRDAFLCLFPKSIAIKDALQSDALKQLESRRSLIVHRSGIIDAAFCKKTGVNQKEIGSYLNISDEEVNTYGTDTINVASKMMNIVSPILSNHKK